jgi:hypothetical protein
MACLHCHDKFPAVAALEMVTSYPTTRTLGSSGPRLAPEGHEDGRICRICGVLFFRLKTETVLKVFGREPAALKATPQPKVTGYAEPAIARPPGGYEDGFARLVRGKCPWCGFSITHVSIGKPSGLTWSCAEGCNP